MASRTGHYRRLYVGWFYLRWTLWILSIALVVLSGQWYRGYMGTVRTVCACDLARADRSTGTANDWARVIADDYRAGDARLTRIDARRGMQRFPSDDMLQLDLANVLLVGHRRQAVAMMSKVILDTASAARGSEGARLHATALAELDGNGSR